MRHESLIRRGAVLLIVALGVGYALWSFPADPTDQSRLLDFSEFYAVGNIVRHGLGQSLYDLRLQAEFQLQVAPVHAFYLRPPFEALLFIPFSYLSYRSAYAAWVLCSLAILLFTLIVIRKNTNVMEALAQYTRGIPADTGLLLILFLSFAPVMNCFMIGQDSMLMLLIYTMTFLALKREREFAAGCLLACGLFKFHLVLPFVFICVLRQRFRFLAGFAAVGLILAVISILICGPGVITAYPNMFLNRNDRALMNFQPEYAANLRGLVYLLWGSKVPGHAADVIVVIASLALLGFIARRWRDSALELSFSAVVVAALLTGFHSFVYDLSLLLLPIAIVCGEMAKRQKLLSNSVLNTLLIVLFVPPVHHLLIVRHIYSVMCVALLLLLGVILKILKDSPDPCAP